MFHAHNMSQRKCFTELVHNILGQFVSRETLSCVHNPNIGNYFSNVSRETCPMMLHIINTLIFITLLRITRSCSFYFNFM